MTMEIEGAADQQHAARPQDAVDLLEAQPEALHVLEGAQGQDRTHGGIGLRQGLDAGHQVHARPRAKVHADILAAGEKIAQVGQALLSFDLIRADLQDRPRQGKGFSHRLSQTT
jgi:hypothetical protein